MTYLTDKEVEERFKAEFWADWKEGEHDSGSEINFWLTQRKNDLQAILGEIENWKYGYDNYPTMMENKKSFKEGEMARELAENLSTKIKSLIEKK